MRESITVLDVLSLPVPFPMGPTHTRSGPAQEDDVPSSPSGVWGSQVLVYHWLLFTQAMLCWPPPV